MSVEQGTRLEELTPGALVRGIVPHGPVQIEHVKWQGTSAITVFYTDEDGAPGTTVLYRENQPALTLVNASSVYSFTADSSLFRLAAEAYRIHMAGEFDPLIAVTTSDLDPLPHQLRAVYEEMIDRRPLRFVLADDPGAGKTIMAGLYIKELVLRGDVARCIIVVPGGLVDQWQDELLSKFGLSFHILTRSDVEASPDGNPFLRHPMLLVRMDFLARNEDLLAHLKATDWDLAIVDEAHRMSANYFSGELKKTKRYELGQTLGTVSRHLLLMTATPHSGKPESFQLFMALLDGDRFEGRYREGVHSSNVDGLMRRMVKEELLTFEGKPLFPDREAQTIAYQLSDAERELYEAVTAYVKEQMGRVQRMKQEGQGKRGNMIGFALTVLQRRLASSPEAIYRSLERRRKRLETKRHELATGGDQATTLDHHLEKLEGLVDIDYDDDDLEELDSGQTEQVEEQLVDGLTTAETIEQLDVEIFDLKRLEAAARAVRNSGVDVKWAELRKVLDDAPEVRDGDERRKIIVFTEHRDTLEYLVEKIRGLIGRDEAVVSIHGGIAREKRRDVQERFTTNKDVVVLVATDAAGEGLNLQQAHLMVNYDLPWNPNRLEQRFGRIHRIGQKEVCRLWNLLAADTREGEVYRRLLEKIEEQKKVYDGKLFDVLGKVFEEVSLKDMIMEAVIDGDRPEVRDRLNQVIDDTVSEGIDRLIAERAMYRTPMDIEDVNDARRRIEEAKARKLQPGYIQSFFLKAFELYGGQIQPREHGRYEISRVPQRLRDADRPRGLGAPLQEKYERVCFKREDIHPEGLSRATLVAPGHPLIDSVIAVVLEDHRALLKEGAVLVDDNDSLEDPFVVVALFEELRDGHEETLSKRFGFAAVNEAGAIKPAGHAPWTDCRVPTSDEREQISALLQQEWLKRRVEKDVTDWAIAEDMHSWSQEWKERQSERATREEALVKERLLAEINYWDQLEGELKEARVAGKKLKISPETAHQRARDLEGRLSSRLSAIELSTFVAPVPPVVAGAALVVPAGFLERVAGKRHEPPDVYARETKEVDERAIAAVMAAERELHRHPEEMPHNNKGFDISSQTPDGGTIIIEVKGRIAGANNFIITRSEVNAGLEVSDYRLALVRVSPEGPEHDEVRYCNDPFEAIDVSTFRQGPFETATLTVDWDPLWKAGSAPF